MRCSVVTKGRVETKEKKKERQKKKKKEKKKKEKRKEKKRKKKKKKKNDRKSRDTRKRTLLGDVAMEDFGFELHLGRTKRVVCREREVDEEHATFVRGAVLKLQMQRNTRDS